VEDPEDTLAAGDAAATGEFVPFDPAEFGVEQKAPAPESRVPERGKRSAKRKRASV
jgi:hypothetical protein